MSSRILIADDNATIRLLLRRLLEKHPSWHVCGDASNGAEAIQKIDQLEPIRYETFYCADDQSASPLYPR